MNQFRNKDLNASQRTFSSGVPDPDTLLPLVDSFDPIPLSPPASGETIILPILPIKQEQDTAPIIIRTELEQQQLTHLVSGEDYPSPSTEPVAAIAADKNPKITYYTNEGNLPTMELLICAIMHHIRECRVIPQIVFASTELASKFRKDMEDIYGEEAFNGTLPFPVPQMTIQHIPIDFVSTIAEDTVLCVAGLRK